MRKPMIVLISLFTLALVAIAVSCGDGKNDPTPTPSPSPAVTMEFKWNLWNNGTQLRGANIWQRRVYQELDGPDFLGSALLGPPYTQEDLNQLAGLGANYVNISHPGLFTENPPYLLDEEIQANLDDLLNLIAKADMFAVISFRTGPGRSEFTFYLDDVGDWFDESYLNDWVWQEQEAQDAWVEMWRYTAELYKDNPIIVGYDLMVEANSNDALLNIWKPEDFYPEYANSTYDWNLLYPRIVEAIRDVDTNTPILVGGMGYSAIEWLPYLEQVNDRYTIYVVHQYEPFQYTHQNWDALELSYPTVCDLDGDGESDRFNQAWLNELISPVEIFMATNSVPVAVNEFGVLRWQLGAADFMNDQIALFEQLGMNYALWLWDPSWPPWTERVNGWNFRYGPDPENHEEVDSVLQDVIKKYWGRNTIRPSALAGP